MEMVEMAKMEMVEMAKMKMVEMTTKNKHDNGNHDGNVGGAGLDACECTYKEFLSCQLFNLKGTEGAVRLARWFEKIESVFHISNCQPKYQVKYASCTLQDGALTWWNSHKKTIGTEKMESELWNLTMKGNDLVAYTQRFQELFLLCPKMVPAEEDRVERYIWGLPDSIQGNVTSSAPTRLQDPVGMANSLMDQKVFANAARHVDNKKRENHPRDNRAPQ
ncbi:hypothetical protein Tco_1085287 [Tanacetum coccineum]